MLISILISYFLLESILFSIIFSFSTLILLLLSNKNKKENKAFKDKVNNMCNFINLINSEMIHSISIYEAYEKVENELPVEYLNMSKEDMFDQLDEIVKDYDMNCFKMYINDLKVFSQSNVDFFEQVKYSTKLCMQEKENINSLKQKKYNVLKQVNYLYVLWISLLVFIKIVISDYYSLMLSETIYKFLIFLVLFLGALLYYFAYKEYLKIKDV